MKTFRNITAVAAVLVAFLAMSIAPAKAQMTPTGDGYEELGTTSLASALNIDQPVFDSNWENYDIMVHLVNRVLAAKPDSDLVKLKDGTIPLTAFIPDDFAFRGLAAYRNGRGVILSSEARVFRFITKLSIATLEKILIYHLVPVGPIGVVDLITSNGLVLPTDQGSLIRVTVSTSVRLIDLSSQTASSLVHLRKVDINSGNRQIAHSITAVMLPSY